MQRMGETYFGINIRNTDPVFLLTKYGKFIIISTNETYSLTNPLQDNRKGRVYGETEREAKRHVAKGDCNMSACNVTLGEFRESAGAGEGS